MKYLLWMLVIGALWWAWRRPRPSAPPPTEVRPAERIQRCAHCGVLFPESEAIHRDGQVFCCAGHAALGMR